MLTITMVHHCLWMPFNFRLGVVFCWFDFEWDWGGVLNRFEWDWRVVLSDFEWILSEIEATQNPLNFTQNPLNFAQNPLNLTQNPLTLLQNLSISLERLPISSKIPLVSWNFTPLYVFTQNLDSKTFRTRYFVPYVQHVSQLNCEKTYFRFQIKIIIVIVFMIWDWMLKVFPTQFLSTVFFDLDLLAPPLQLKPTQNQLDFTQCILHE